MTAARPNAAAFVHEAHGVLRRLPRGPPNRSPHPPRPVPRFTPPHLVPPRPPSPPLPLPAPRPAQPAYGSPSQWAGIRPQVIPDGREEVRGPSHRMPCYLQFKTDCLLGPRLDFGKDSAERAVLYKIHHARGSHVVTKLKNVLR